MTPVDHGTAWAGLVDSGEPFVLHDALCPMTPACVHRRVRGDRGRAATTVVVGVRPVTDTVKRRRRDGTSARPSTATTWSSVASPVVLPAGVVAALDGLPTLDFAELVAWLRGRFPVRLVEAPPEAARVRSLDDMRALEEQTAPTR